MGPGLVNGEQHWISEDGNNALWAKENGVLWHIGPSNDLGDEFSYLYRILLQCPYDLLQSTWIYHTGNDYRLDVNNSVRVTCKKGENYIIILIR